MNDDTNQRCTSRSFEFFKGRFNTAPDAVRKIVNCMLAFGFAVRDETVQNRLAELPVPQQIPSSTNDLAETVTILDVLRSTLMLGRTSFGRQIAHLGYFEREFTEARKRQAEIPASSIES